MKTTITITGRDVSGNVACATFDAELIWNAMRLDQEFNPKHFRIHELGGLEVVDDEGLWKWLPMVEIEE